MGELDIGAFMASPAAQAAGGLLLGLIVGLALSTALTRALVHAASRTQNELDDVLIAILRRPVLVTVVILAFRWSGDLLRLPSEHHRLIDGTLGTIGVFVWALGLVGVADAVMRVLHHRPGSWLRGRASALMHYAVRLVVLAISVYVLEALWDWDLKAWTASVGVLGVVLAIAAQDSLGNMVSGFFILADRPLQIGDFVQVDANLSGRVTDIGWRSTRFLTTDGVEVNFPNGKLSEARVVNESAGPHPAIRIWCEFPVEFGRSPAEIEALVLPGASTLCHVLATPAPCLYFRGQTHVGLRFALVVYVADPALRRDVLDEVNSYLYRTLRAAGVGFAYSTHSVLVEGPLAGALHAVISDHVAADMS